jgi:dynein intermediate chain 2
MADQFTYQKKRKEFGRPAQFSDSDTKIVGNIPPDPSQSENFIMKDPKKIILSNIPNLSTHSVRFIAVSFIEGEH